MSPAERINKKQSSMLSVLFDSREQTPWDPLPGVTMTRATLSEGDYTTELLQGGIGVIERKSITDFASTITRDRERFEDELRRLRECRWRCLVVEGDITEVYRVTAAHPNSILGTVASLTARWDCPVIFAGNREGAARIGFGVLSRWQGRLQNEGSAA